jgi:hypothetical protein
MFKNPSKNVKKISFNFRSYSVLLKKNIKFAIFLRRLAEVQELTEHNF